MNSGRTSNVLQQPLAELVALDPWFSSEDGNLNLRLHVDATFGSAAFRGSSSAPVCFTLKLKAAQIVVIVPPTEPVEIVRSSVARDNDLPVVTQSLKHRRSQTAKVGTEIALDLSLRKPNAAANLTDKGSTEKATELATQLDRTGGTLAVQHGLTTEGHHRWSITPAGSAFLRGKPWEAKTAPRMTLRKRRAAKKSKDSIGATVFIEVHCDPRDLTPTNIEITNKREFAALKKQPGYRNREAAVSAAIMAQITQRGLAILDPSSTKEIVLSVVPCNERDNADL